jgi:Domain of unknown function (DUF4157)
VNSKAPTRSKAQVSAAAVPAGLLQRRCACGGTGHVGGECAECQKKRLNLQRKGAGLGVSGIVPPIVSEVLHSPGRQLDEGTLALMGGRFGHDFSRVRVHDDVRAAESARAVDALAYTVGSHLVFGTGQYSPGSVSGKRLLAHELTHVIQQGGGDGPVSRLGDPFDPAERQAEGVAESFASGREVAVAPRERAPVLQRRMVVTPIDLPLPPGAAGPPVPFTLAVQNLCQETCPSGNFQVDPGTGVVSSPNIELFCQWHPPFLPDVTEADLSPTPAGCRCLCDVITNPQTLIIDFNPGGPRTSPGSVPGAGLGQGGVTANPTVLADPQFQGQYRIGDQWVDVPFHLLFAHEVCGHALPKMRGTHTPRGSQPKGGTPPQEVHAVDVERQVAAEHNPPLPRRPDDYDAARQRP